MPMQTLRILMQDWSIIFQAKSLQIFWLDKIYSAEEGYAHRNADIHIHDLDCLTGYCAGWSLRVLLNEGFNGVRVKSQQATQPL